MMRALLFAVVLGALLAGPYVSMTSGHIGESVFASVTEPVGVAVTPGRVLVTQPLCGDPRRVLSINETGAASVFATLPSRGGGCYEDYLAVAGPADPTQPGFPSPTRGGFPSNYVYVTQGPSILKISPTGVVSSFTTVPACQQTRTGITFDQVGMFGFNMIVTCDEGTIWKVTAAGTVTLIANVADAHGFPSIRIENPSVAPLTFAPYGGYVFVAAQVLGKVIAVSPSGTVSMVADWSGAEGVQFVPANKCNAGATGGTFFTALYKPAADGTGSIVKFPLSAFAGLSGRALVTSETGAGIGLLTSTGAGTIVPTLYHENLGPHEGSAFADCTVPLLLKITVKPGSIPHTINPRSEGTVPVAILSGPGFNAVTDVVIPSVRFGVTGTENSIVRCNRSGQDVNGDGRLDLICHGAANRLGITTSGVYRGLLIVKLFYNAPGGDPAGEGAD